MSASHNRVPIGKRQCGFTLLEILIAIVLLGVGLLGLAGLQAVSLRNNHSAYLRSQATMLAYEIIDRMRTNRVSAQAGRYDIALGPYSGPAPQDCTAVSCDGTQLAAYELQDWKQRLPRYLPSGDGSIARLGQVFTITLQWTDERGADAAKLFAMSTEI